MNKVIVPWFCYQFKRHLLFAFFKNKAMTVKWWHLLLLVGVE
jgi:hypothetical protein